MHKDLRYPKLRELNICHEFFSTLRITYNLFKTSKYQKPFVLFFLLLLLLSTLKSLSSPSIGPYLASVFVFLMLSASKSTSLEYLVATIELKTTKIATFVYCMISSGVTANIYTLLNDLGFWYLEPSEVVFFLNCIFFVMFRGIYLTSFSVLFVNLLLFFLFGSTASIIFIILFISAWVGFNLRFVLVTIIFLYFFLFTLKDWWPLILGEIVALTSISPVLLSADLFRVVSSLVPFHCNDHLSFFLGIFSDYKSCGEKVFFEYGMAVEVVDKNFVTQKGTPQAFLSRLYYELGVLGLGVGLFFLWRVASNARKIEKSVRPGYRFGFFLLLFFFFLQHKLSSIYVLLPLVSLVSQVRRGRSQMLP